MADEEKDQNTIQSPPSQDSLAPVGETVSMPTINQSEMIREVSNIARELNTLIYRVESIKRFAR